MRDYKIIDGREVRYLTEYPYKGCTVDGVIYNIKTETKSKGQDKVQLFGIQKSVYVTAEKLVARLWCDPVKLVWGGWDVDFYDHDPSNKKAENLFIYNTSDKSRNSGRPGKKARIKHSLTYVLKEFNSYKEVAQYLKVTPAAVSKAKKLGNLAKGWYIL